MCRRIFPKLHIPCLNSAAQKIKKLSETPGTVPIVAKSCKNDIKKRKIAEKLVQPVTPHLGCFQWGLQWPYLVIYGHMAIRPYAANIGMWGIPEKLAQ